MAGQPATGFQWTNIGTIGTNVLKDSAARLVRVVIPGTYTGTVNFHNAGTATGTTATSSVLSLGIPNTNVGGNIEVDANLPKGLLVQATGTPVLTVIWD